MGRRKNSETNGSASADGAEPGIGHNNELSDEDRQALFFQWKRDYEDKLARKKEADAALKNCCKQAKAELGKTVVADIKLAIEVATEQGEAAIKERMESQARVLRWLGLPIGVQGNLFAEVDLTPANEKARANGKRAGLAGEACQPPHDPSVPQYQEWMDGWQEGQAIHLRNGIRPMPLQENVNDDDDDLRPRFMQAAEAERLGTEPATHTVTE